MYTVSYGNSAFYQNFCDVCYPVFIYDYLRVATLVYGLVVQVDFLRIVMSYSIVHVCTSKQGIKNTCGHILCSFATNGNLVYVLHRNLIINTGLYRVRKCRLAVILFHCKMYIFIRMYLSMIHATSEHNAFSIIFFYNLCFISCLLSLTFMATLSVIITKRCELDTLFCNRNKVLEINWFCNHSRRCL